ncbi:MAG TPA: ABC transporter permease, partial [Candidatus Dormibacteraeota bacterium]|nr:ABC transporter permease [Candidatus Dormibacteraeota bacterium]
MSDSLYLVLWRGGFVNVATIARRELLSLGLSPAGWVAAAAMIVPVSAFGFLPEFIGRQLGQMDQVFAAFPLVLTLVVPFYTMRLIAAEWREGTLELLLTAPVRDWEVVLGKWLGVVAFYLTSITFTGFYVLLIAAHLGGEAVLDWGAVWAGYAGLILIGGFFIAVGLLASTLSSNSVLG